MPSEYIEQRNGGCYVAGTRISLDSVVYAFNRGDSPGRILARYPLLGKPARRHPAFLSESDPTLWGRLQRAR